MEENTRFYLCGVCGKVIGLIHDTEVPTVCCGEEMTRLKGNTSDGAVEKHVPVYEVDEINEEIIVKVGDVDHPMEEDHYIMWVALLTDNSTTRIRLLPGEAPTVRMKYIEGSTVYAYCNKHGLWKTDIE